MSYVLRIGSVANPAGWKNTRKMTLDVNSTKTKIQLDTIPAAEFNDAPAYQFNSGCFAPLLMMVHERARVA